MMFELVFPSPNATVSLQTAAQQTFVGEEQRRAAMDGSRIFQWYGLESEGVDCTLPLPVSFSWKHTTDSEESDEAYFYLLVCENEDMHDAWVFITKDTSYDVYNLKVDTTYFWCVQKNGKRSNASSFHTRLTLPRCLKIHNISNVRDMGGYAVEGGKIRQGLVYRGGETERHMHLSPDGANTFRRLGLRTELDMRGEVEGQIDFTTAQAIGVNRVFVPIEPYQEIFNKDYLDSVATFFKVFTKKSNYPLYFHCWSGADRTGTFAFILGAFLGMRLSDLIYDYEFSSLSLGGIRTRNFDEFQAFLTQFMRLPGNTMHEKGEAFLRKYACLTDKQIENIYHFLVEKER